MALSNPTISRPLATQLVSLTSHFIHQYGVHLLLISDSYLKLDTAASWEDSKASCEFQNGSLAIIRTEADQRAAQQMCSNFNQNSETCWIGGVIGDNTAIEWVDGTRGSFLNFIPNRNALVGACVGMDLNGRWVEVDCDNTFHPLCQRSSNSPVFEMHANYSIAFLTGTSLSNADKLRFGTVFATALVTTSKCPNHLPERTDEFSQCN